MNNIKDALRPLRKLFRSSRARDFGADALELVRDEMIRAGLCRTTINARVNRIRRVFKWAARKHHVPAAVHHDLATIEALQPGLSGAKEPTEVRPVPVEQVEAALPFLSAPVAAMVRLQLLTGCRAGEVMRMRGCDLTESESIWEYRPATHKNAWRGKKKVIPLGPRAQEVIKAFLKPDPDAYLFSSADAVAAHHAGRAGGRKSRPTPSEKSRRAKAGPGAKHAARYDRRAYRQAIVRACDRAFPLPTLSAIRPKDLTAEQRAELRAWRVAHRWSPLQLRHTAATLIRTRYGLEAAQNVLGHAKADVTQLYAERDLDKVRTIMAEVG